MRYTIPGLLILLFVTLCACSKSDQINLHFDSRSPISSYGANRFEGHLVSAGKTVSINPRGKSSGPTVFILTRGLATKLIPNRDLSDYFEKLSREGYHILTQSDTVFVLGKTDQGCLYGIMGLIEQLGPKCDFGNLEEKKVNPAFAFRAIKFNLPWAPYRPGPATDLHKETCRDLEFWEAYLDMMVTNRFNALTLWSAHLFPYMIRAENYPEATPLNHSKLHEWQTFWKALFKMAKERGIETYLVNWNIVVSPEFASEYDAKVHDDRSELVKKYTRESVTQLINEYDDLTGLGVTLADWMGNWGADKMTPVEREEWIEDTFVEGMKEADRKVKFIHRAVLAGDPMEMRRVIDAADLPDRTIVEVKFNWSHGHSTPHLSLTHSNDEGTIMRDFWDPMPDNYFIAWMVRNEDFFVLRWGNPDFIREHIRTNHHEYVDGYFVGSEGYIPAMDYSHKEHPHKTWKYAFQKQWLFYHLWGRLIFNPDEKNETLAKAFEFRYPPVSGNQLLEAYSLASKVPLHLASFYKSTWDFTLYSEGFLAPWTTGYDDGKSPFISLEELIRHEVLDTRYISISEFCHKNAGGIPLEKERITPTELADTLKMDCAQAMQLISELRSMGKDPTLESELDDLETWCHLGFYFAEKLRAGVALETFRYTGEDEDGESAKTHLTHCITNWENVIRMTEERYQPMPYVSMGHHEQKWIGFKVFHWKSFLEDVKADFVFTDSITSIYQ